ncbi:MAG: hypothetical protein H6737_24170 [Alphaproteobacteria bacterium]|nr:hypothetical protein [Alphaproteobacteria bacterium]
MLPAREVVEDLGLGHPAVGGGEHAQGAARGEVAVQDGTKVAVPLPEEEGADEVDAVGRSRFEAERDFQRTLLIGVDVQT